MGLHCRAKDHVREVGGFAIHWPDKRLVFVTEATDSMVVSGWCVEEEAVTCGDIARVKYRILFTMDSGSR